MYEAAQGEGAVLNGKLIERRPRRERPLIPVPGAVHQELLDAGLDYRRGPLYPSLAYRLVQVATGKLDAVVARRGSQDWDLAAATVILAEAGVEFADVCMGDLRFNRAETRHGALAALNEVSLKPVLHAALIKVYGCPDPIQDELEVRAP